MVHQVNVQLLSDTPVDEDAFGGHKRVAGAIAELVQSEDGGKAIALEGGWGSGKSSIVRMLEKKFDQHDTRFLVFDAWSHDGDPLRRVFLEELTSLCNREFDQKTKEKWIDRTKKEITGREIEREQTTTPVLKSKWPILVLASASLYPVAIVAFGALLRQKDPDAGILGLIVACVVMSVAPFFALFGLFIYLCINRTKGGLETAGSLISLWSKEIDETISTTAHETIEPTSIDFQAYFSDLVKEYLGEPKRRLVIVLDNLDRVPESTARMLWATLRVFADCCDNNQEWSKRIWFIVPYDREAAASLWDEDHQLHVDRLTNDGRESDASEPTENEYRETNGRTTPTLPIISAAFLDKTFQVRFVVPPLHIADWEDYLNTQVEKAMPGVGSVEERHRVYRLSERLADEKGRPPSPRHLKLYVNDIGAIVRQFGRNFPIDHLALYTIQRRQCRDIRLWITSGEFTRDPLAQVMPDDTFVSSLLCIYFGTEDELSAATLTLGGPLRQHLRNGEGEKIREAVQVRGFWNVAEVELQKNLEADEKKQKAVIDIATAVDASGLDTASPPRYAHVIPAFAKKVLKSADWKELDEDAACAAEILLRIANDPDTTSDAFSRLVSGEPENPSVASKSKPWAMGTTKLVDVAKSLGHEFRIAIPGDGAQTIACLASIGKRMRTRDVLERLSCKCPVAEIQSEVAPTTADEWTDAKSIALRTLHTTPQVTVNWNELLTAFSARLQVDAIAIPEAKRLLNAFFDLCHRLPNKVKAASTGISRHASFYVHVEKWSADANAVASVIALQVLAGNVGRAATGPEEPGHAFLQTLFTSPNDKQDIVDEYVGIVIERPTLSLLGHTIAQRSPLSAFFKLVLTTLAEREDAAVGLPATLYLEQFDVLKEHLENELTALTTKLLTSSEFRRDLAEINVDLTHAGAISQLIQAGASDESAYRDDVFGFLNSVDEETWEQAIWEVNATYDLLVSCCGRGWTATSQLEDAVEAIGLRLCNEEHPEIAFSDVRRLWTSVYEILGPQRRGTAARKIVDALEHQVPNRMYPLIAMFNDDLAKAFAEGDGDSLVRQVAEPIIKNEDQKQIAWLNKVVQYGQAFWDAAPDDDKGTFSQSLWLRVGSDDNGEIATLLRQIAQLLNLQEPTPDDDETTDEEGDQSEDVKAE